VSDVARMIPLTPNWQSIAIELRRRYGSDDRIADELALQGVLIDRTALSRIRSGTNLEPRRFEVCAAMLNLYEASKPAQQNKSVAERREVGRGMRLANTPCAECEVDTLHVNGKCNVCGNIERNRERPLKRTRYGFNQSLFDPRTPSKE